MADTSGLDVVPLTADRWSALEALFREGGDPRWCWCMYWRLRSTDFSRRTVAELRDGLRALGEQGQPPGLVALRDERAVGWVSLGHREDFERLERSRTIPHLDGRHVWSIVCFVVARGARGQGVGASLLAAAVAWAHERGAAVLEAYPVDVPPGATVHPDAAFTGTLAMFERAGFRRVADTASTSAGLPRVVVRRDLADSR